MNLSTTPPSPTDTQRTFRLGLLEGIGVIFGMTLTEPGAVLSLFIRALGGSNLLVGLVSPLRFGGWFLPQLLMAGWVERRVRKMPSFVAIATLRLVCYALIAAVVLLVPSPHTVLIFFFILYAGSRVAAGSANVSRTDIIGRALASDRRRTFFSQRAFWGGLVGIGAGFVVGFVLDEGRGWSFQARYALIFGLAAAAISLSIAAFSRIREPLPTDYQPLSVSWLDHLRGVPTLIRRDVQFGRLVLALSLLGMVRLATPFFVLYAHEELGAPASIAGMYLGILSLAALVSNLVWDRIGRRWGDARLLFLGGMLRLGVPLVALLIPAVPWSNDVAIQLFGLVFVFQGLSNSGVVLAQRNYVLTIAPRDQRPTYVGVMNTMLGLANFLPIISGALVDWWGYVPVFALSGLLIGLGVLTALRVAEPEQAPPTERRVQPAVQIAHRGSTCGDD